MTTIAYDGKRLAADTQATTPAGGVCPADIRKLHYITHDGHHAVVGVCGTLAHLGDLARAFLDGVTLTPCRDAHGIVIVLLDGGTHRAFVMDGHASGLEITGKAYAVGSGGDYALGAMLMGAGAERAVKVACSVDPGSGGDVQVMELRRAPAKRGGRTAKRKPWEMP